MPAQEGRRPGAQINGYIPDPTLQTAHELHFGVRHTLEMHASHRAHHSGARMIDLDNMTATHNGCQFPLTKQSCQRAAMVPRSEEHTSELQSLMRISYAVFCLTKK